jgi:hypothetical protein
MCQVQSIAKRIPKAFIIYSHINNGHDMAFLLWFQVIDHFYFFNQGFIKGVDVGGFVFRKEVGQFYIKGIGNFSHGGNSRLYLIGFYAAVLRPVDTYG